MVNISNSAAVRGATTSLKLGSNFLVYGITTLLQRKLDRSTQFGAVGYIITLCSSKIYVKIGGPSKFWGSGFLDLQWLGPWQQLAICACAAMTAHAQIVSWYSVTNDRLVLPLASR